MRTLPIVRLSLALALAAGLGASPALAQKKPDKNHRRPSVERVERRPELRHRERDARARKQVPPGWCQGRGNPHNTPENCGWGAERRRDDVYRRDNVRYDSRTRSRAYDVSHADFHRALDEKHRRLSAQRPRDVQYQLRLRAQKRAEHDRWHERIGVHHDGTRGY